MYGIAYQRLSKTELDWQWYSVGCHPEYRRDQTVLCIALIQSILQNISTHVVMIELNLALLT